MTNIIIFPNKITKRSKIEKDLYWYDSKNQLEYTGKGGEMVFIYDTRLKTSVPYIKDVYSETTTYVYDKIEQLISEYDDDSEIELMKQGNRITVTLNNDDKTKEDEAADDLEELIISRGLGRVLVER